MDELSAFLSTIKDELWLSVRHGDIREYWRVVDSIDDRIRAQDAEKVNRMTCDACSRITKKNHSKERLGIQRCEDCAQMIQDRFMELSEMRDLEAWRTKAERAVDRAFELNR